MPAANRGKIKYRRSATLLSYWQNNELAFENYARRSGIVAEPLVSTILHYCSKWRTAAQISAFLGRYSESSVQQSLNQLCKNGLLDSSAAKPAPQARTVETWQSWNPAAGYFHFATKDFDFAPDQLGVLKALQRRARHDPMPLPVKSYPKARKTALTHTPAAGEFPRILKNRRTWRIYGKEPVLLETLAQTLRLTFGIQGWVDVPGLGRAAMKTSPSCGCLHPIEAYVLALRVKGLHKGFYHYNAQRHELEWLREGVTRKVLEKNIGHQWWFTESAFLIAMTAVFGRTRWKYKFPRVYRGILLEAGHLCQTFCLTATWKGLAPFSTIAYQDTQWEKWLGLDGVSESVLYLAGAGTRPSSLKGAHMAAL